MTTVSSTTSVTRTQYEPAPVREPQKTRAQKEQESPTLNLSAGQAGDRTGDGTGASYSIMA